MSESSKKRERFLDRHVLHEPRGKKTWIPMKRKIAREFDFNPDNLSPTQLIAVNSEYNRINGVHSTAIEL